MAPRRRPRSRWCSKPCCCSGSCGDGWACTCWRSGRAAEPLCSSCPDLIRASIIFAKIFQFDGLPGHLARRRASRFCRAMTNLEVEIAEDPPLLRGPAAVDREVGAGDWGGVVAAEKQGEGCDLLGGDELLGRLRGQQHVVDYLLLGQVARLHGLRNLVLDQRRPDITRADAVAGDLEGRKLQRHRLGE